MSVTAHTRPRASRSVAEARERQGTGETGAVYMLRFDPPYKHAGRYVGWTAVGRGETAREAVLDRRDQHIAGKGSPLVEAAVKAGCMVTIVRVWEGVDRHFERTIKLGKNSARHDPVETGQQSLADCVRRHH